MTASESTVWPNDVMQAPRELERDSPHRLVCFLLSPFEPREVFDPVHDAVSTACKMCAESAGIEIECRRADTLSEAKTIHDDIWRHIAAADLLVVDVTGLRPNVMIELGIAAAVRRPTQVILIKAEDDPSSLPFNAFAQRYLPYSRSILGDRQFLVGLHTAMIQAITPAPYSPVPSVSASSESFAIDFARGDRPALVLSPGITHRRLLGDCLEFGSFYVFRNSWLLLTTGEYRNVKVRVRFRFSAIAKTPEGAFLGISLRNQHFHANWGHLFYLRADGRVIRTEPIDDTGEYRDVKIGDVPNFNYKQPGLIDLTAAFQKNHLSLSVGPIQASVAVEDMPYVYAAGKVRVSASQCRVCIREIELKSLEDE